MKWQSLFLFFTIIIFSSCNQSEEHYQLTDYEMYLEKVVAEVSSGERNDTIFAGLTFGLTPDEYQGKIKNLVRDKILYENSIGQAIFMLELGQNFPGEIKTTLYPKFSRGKLYELSLILNFEPGSKELMQSLLEELKSYYEKSYNSKFSEYTFIPTGEKTYYLIQGNRAIEISGTSNPIVTYSDKSANHLSEAEQEKRKLEILKQL